MKGKHHKKKQQNHHPSDSVVTTAEKNHAAAHKATNQPESQDKTMQHEKKSWIPAATLFVGVVVCVIYFFQLRAMVRSNEISRQSLQAVQRAYVVFDKIFPTRHNLGDVHFMQYFGIFENSGNTPAIDAINSFSCSMLPTDSVVSDQQFQGIPASGLTAVIIGPKESPKVGGIMIREMDVFGSDLGDMNRAPKLPNSSEENGGVGFTRPQQFYCWGWVAYRDVFPKTEPHLTEFCVRLAGWDINTKQQDLTHDFIACKTHNCTDQRCGDYQKITDMLPPTSQ